MYAADASSAMKIFPTSLNLEDLTVWEVAKLAGLGFFVWSGVTFITTEPNRRSVRYDCNEILEGKNLLKNFKYLILDGLIGHKSKLPSMRCYPGTTKISPQLCEVYDDINPETNVLINQIGRPGADSKGIYGWASDYTKPTITMLCFAAIAKTMYKEGLEGFSDWSTLLSLTILKQSLDSE